MPGKRADGRSDSASHHRVPGRAWPEGHRGDGRFHSQQAEGGLRKLGSQVLTSYNLPKKEAVMRRTSIVAVACVILCVALPVAGQSGAKGGEWRTYGGDLGSTHYSPLDQIKADNFNKLEVAWRFKTDSLGPRPEYQFEGTPLMVKGVLYSTAGSRRDAIALDAATGELLWVHGENEGARGQAAPRQLSGHG